MGAAASSRKKTVYATPIKVRPKGAAAGTSSHTTPPSDKAEDKGEPTRARLQSSSGAAAFQAAEAIADVDISTLVDAINSGRCIAFVGAGFSTPANLPTWEELLLNIAEESQLLGRDEESHIRRLVKGGLFDQAAQEIQDRLGERTFSSLLAKSLNDRTGNLDELPPQMKERVKLISDIPFAAILTTNYDRIIQGGEKKPWAVNMLSRNEHERARCARVMRRILRPVGEFVYEEVQYVLHNERTRQEGRKVARQFTRQPTEVRDEDTPGVPMASPRGAVKPLMQAAFSQRQTYLSDAPRLRHDGGQISFRDLALRDLANRQFRSPVLQLHGSLDEPESIVITRQNYRSFINRYGQETLSFLKTAMSTFTFLYIGISFRDEYLTNLRSSVLALLDDDLSEEEPTEAEPRGATRPRRVAESVAGAAHVPVKKNTLVSVEAPRVADAANTQRSRGDVLGLPLAYAIVGGKTVEDAAYFQRHEGLRMLRYKVDEGSADAHKGFDQILRLLHRHTAPEVAWGRRCAGKRLVWVDAYAESRLADAHHAVSPERINQVVGEFDSYEDALERKGFQAASCWHVARLVQFLHQASEVHGDGPPITFEFLPDGTGLCERLADGRAVDVVITFFGACYPTGRERETPVALDVLDAVRRRTSPERCCPVVVFGSGDDANHSRSRLVLKNGALRYCTTMVDVIAAIDSCL